jgi:hypothetical protein
LEENTADGEAVQMFGNSDGSNLVAIPLKPQVRTRNLTQIRSHAQKFYKKLERDQRKQCVLQQRLHEAMMGKRRADDQLGKQREDVQLESKPVTVHADADAAPLGVLCVPSRPPSIPASHEHVAAEHVAACMLLLSNDSIGSAPGPGHMPAPLSMLANQRQY